MNRIDEKMNQLRRENKKAFITFITAGAPDVETTKQAIYTMEQEGVDLIEIGVPFSDPSADGPVIQQADVTALANGVDIFRTFEIVKEVRKTVKIPMVFLLYYNVMLQYGLDRFFEKCVECGIDGLVIPDLPFEECEEIAEYTEKYGVYQIQLVSPTSKERIKKIASSAKGFLYCISSLGVTGEKSKFETDFGKFFERIHRYKTAPACIGFGISNGEQVERLTKYCDGAIVGSAVVKALNKGNTVEEHIQSLKEKIADLKSGL